VVLKIESKGDVHVVVASKRLVAVRTLTGPGGETFLHTVFAESMAARFDHRILEIAAAHRAQDKRLERIKVSGSI
jgi:hypothetical protein